MDNFGRENTATTRIRFPWRRALALAGCVGLFAATSAGAQTTSTSSTSSTSQTSTSSTSSSTTTSTAPMTSTTLGDLCTGQSCIAGPPEAFLVGAARDIRLGLAESCWRDGTPGGVTKCTSALLTQPAVVVGSGETFSLRFATDLAPTGASLSVGGVTTALDAGNPMAIPVEFPTGTDTITVATRWLQGDARYLVTLDVRPPAAPPAEPRPRAVSLTG